MPPLAGRYGGLAIVRALSLILATLVACAGIQTSPVEADGEAEWAVVGATLIDATPNGSDDGDLENAVALGRGNRDPGRRWSLPARF